MMKKNVVEGEKKMVNKRTKANDHNGGKNLKKKENDFEYDETDRENYLRAIPFRKVNKRKKDAENKERRKKREKNAKLLEKKKNLQKMFTVVDKIDMITTVNDIPSIVDEVPASNDG